MKIRLKTFGALEQMIREQEFSFPEGLQVEGFSYFPFYWMAKAMNAVAAKEYAPYVTGLAYFLILSFLISLALWFLQKKYYIKLFDKLSRSSTVGILTKWKKLIKARCTKQWNSRR